MPTALIIGAGANLGRAIAETFHNAGYSVAVASRSNKTGSKFTHFPFDAFKPDTIPPLFASVTEELGVPSVVVYNAYHGPLTKPNEPFSTPLPTLTSIMNINAITVWAAAHAATDAWLANPDALGSEGGTFLFTGNLFNGTVAPGFMPFGMGKAAGAHLIQYLALLAFEDKPFKFYYPDQRHPDGAPMWTGANGPAHADLYLELAKDPQQREWLHTFVKGQGYKKFEPLESVQRPR